jgi:cold shock protein
MGCHRREGRPGGCWVFFAVIVKDGYRELTAGERVRFTFERAEQDAYHFRATAAWPDGSTT